MNLRRLFLKREGEEFFKLEGDVLVTAAKNQKPNT